MKNWLCKFRGHSYFLDSFAPAYGKIVYVCRRCGKEDWRDASEKTLTPEHIKATITVLKEKINENPL